MVNLGTKILKICDFNACIIKKKPTHLSFCFNVVQHFFEGKFKLAFFSFVLNLKFNCNRGGLFLGERWEETLKSMVEIRRKC